MKKFVLCLGLVIISILLVGCTAADAQVVEAPTTEITTEITTETTPETTVSTEESTTTSESTSTTEETSTTATELTTAIIEEIIKPAAPVPTPVEKKTPQTTKVPTKAETTTILTTEEETTTETILTTDSSITETVVTETTIGEGVTEVVTTPEPVQSNLTFVKTFSRGTYYTAYSGAKGGSGRTLISCNVGNSEVKGSIASSYLYKNYGYNYNGSRTKVYLEVSGYSSMNGYYYLDDSDAGNSNVIDFYYTSGKNCPFQRQGVVTVSCYIVG